VAPRKYTVENTIYLFLFPKQERRPKKKYVTRSLKFSAKKSE